MNSVEAKLRGSGGRVCRPETSKAVLGSLLAAISLGAVCLAELMFTSAALAASSQTGTSFNSAELAERTIERRAFEALIWGMPAVNYDLMLQEMLHKTNGDVNQIVYWSRLPLEEPDAHPEPRLRLPHGFL